VKEDTFNDCLVPIEDLNIIRQGHRGHIQAFQHPMFYDGNLEPTRLEVDKNEEVVIGKVFPERRSDTKLMTRQGEMGIWKWNSVSGDTKWLGKYSGERWKEVLKEEVDYTEYEIYYME